MKRLHVHVSVDDLAQSIRFYSTLFAAEPTVLKDDYAKWMLNDPRVNFAISKREGGIAGISHLGIQAEDEGELAEVYERLSRAERPIVEAKGATCCYPSRISSGSPTRKACRGRPFSPTGRPRSMAKDRSPSSGKRPNVRCAANRHSPNPRPRRLPQRPAALRPAVRPRGSVCPRKPTMFSFSARVTRREASWPRRCSNIGGEGVSRHTRRPLSEGRRSPLGARPSRKGPSRHAQPAQQKLG